MTFGRIPMSTLTALSPLDGRYARHAESLRPIFSEFGLIQRRILVEIRWLLALADEEHIVELARFNPIDRAKLMGIVNNFDLDDAQLVKAIESKTNHDVKAVEYFIKERMQGDTDLERAREFVHFACTSEDINNLAYALMLKDARAEVLLPRLDALLARLDALADAQADTPMLSRTHGQPASPTTLGKEFRNVQVRLARQREALAALSIPGKINGAVGNYNAHQIAYPEVDWRAFAQRFVEGLGLSFNAHTTQIEPHDGVAEMLDALRRIATILIDFCRDVWGYISLGYLVQAKVEGEVGSSTMPHKVNPIDFENAEGNLGIAVALCGHFAEKLPISRWQRDLTDSTTLRALGTAFGHFVVALASLERGLGKIGVDRAALMADLEANPEVLAEAIQTVMRRYGLPEPYERLKALTRGARVNLAQLRGFIETLELDPPVKQRLLDLTPATYTGLAMELARTPA